VNSAWSRSSRSLTVASWLGPGGGRVFSFTGLGGVLSFAGLSSVVTVAAGKLLIIEDCWRAMMSNIWNPTSNAARVMAFLITGRMASTYWGKQSLSTTWPSPAKQSILFTMTEYGKTSWNPHGQKWRRKFASTWNRRASLPTDLTDLAGSPGSPGFLNFLLRCWRHPSVSLAEHRGQSAVHFRFVVHRWG